VREACKFILIDGACKERRMSRPQSAFLIISFSTRAEGSHFIAEWRITVFVSDCVGLI